MKILRFLGWLFLSIASAAGLASFASKNSESEVFSVLFAFVAGLIGFASTWGTRRNLHRWAREMSKDAGMWFFFSILGVGLFISQLAYDQKWQNIFSGAAFALAWLGPIAITQSKTIREFHYDPLSDPENHY
jgi:surface polysaccharide O-acyltransferase-like enzyme